MDTETRIKLAADIVDKARSHGITEYVDNVIEPYKEQAAAFYGVTVADLVETAYEIAHGLEANGFIDAHIEVVHVGGAA